MKIFCITKNLKFVRYFLIHIFPLVEKILFTLYSFSIAILKGNYGQNAIYKIFHFNLCKIWKIKTTNIILTSSVLFKDNSEIHQTKPQSLFVYFIICRHTLRDVTITTIHKIAWQEIFFVLLSFFCLLLFLFTERNLWWCIGKSTSTRETWY